MKAAAMSLLPIHEASPIFLMLGISIQIDARVEEVQTEGMDGRLSIKYAFLIIKNKTTGTCDLGSMPSGLLRPNMIESYLNCGNSDIHQKV